jgi:uncharacterized protein (DUF305 family)
VSTTDPSSPASPDVPEGTDVPSAAASAPPRSAMSAGKIVALVAAVAFLAGAIAFVVGERVGTDEPLSATDVGFMQDMGYHHDQATQLSLILLDKPDVDRSLKSFAQEIIIGQRFEQGIFTALLDRYGFPTEAPDEVMGWMGEPIAIEDMPGMATDEQVAALQEAEGAEAEALWIALMSEHHLAGLHMADHQARYGSDETTVNLAEAIVKGQRSEIVDLARWREDHGLPIPEGFDDPLKDQRLDPMSFRDGSTTTTGG